MAATVAKYHVGCINGSLEGANYSAPIPVIGLYVAGASLLLLLIMLYDIIVAGFYARKRWLPCKYFTLNSVTIMLLSVAAKLTVDLTTPMPRPVDQLSKLTATTMTCVAIGFLGPSFGKKGLEWNADLVSLTIFVFTMVVNICIQISTGVILLFIWEHTFIMVFMMLLLCHLWCFSWSDLGDDSEKSFVPGAKILGREGLYFVLTRFYKFRYGVNRQLLQCMGLHNYTMCGMCVFCSIVSMQAAIRSILLKRLEVCIGSSDYGWSMWTIVVAQILFIWLGCFAVIYRWLAMLNYSDYNVSKFFSDNVKLYVKDENPLRWSRSAVDKSRRGVIFISLLTLYVLQLFFAQVTLVLKFVLKQKPADKSAINEWIARKAKQDTDRWALVWKNQPWDHLDRVLSRTRFRPNQPVNNKVQKNAFFLDVFRRIPIIVHLSKVLLPEILHGSIIGAFAEVKEVILFIASRKLGQEMPILQADWRGRGYSCFLPEILSQLSPDQKLQPELDRTMFILAHLACTLTRYIDHLVHLEIISELLGVLSVSATYERRTTSEWVQWVNEHAWRFSSMEDLSNLMEQLFADYLGIFFIDFPAIVYEFLEECKEEEADEKVTQLLEFSFRLKSFDERWRWDE